MDKKINFDESSVKEYLDECIRYWRKKRDTENWVGAVYYIDAYQSIRESLFGESLPE